MSGPIIIVLLLLAGYAVVMHHQTVRDFFRRTSSSTPPTTTTTAGASSTTRSWWRGTDGKLTSRAIQTVVVSAIGLIALLWAYIAQAGLTDAARLAANNRLLVLILAGVLIGLIAINKDTFGKGANQLGWIVGVTALLLMFAMPVVDWCNSPSAPRPAKPASVPAPIVRDMTPKGHAKITIPPMGRSRLIKVSRNMHLIVEDGDHYRLHNIYTDGRDCVEGCQDGPLSGMVIENVSQESNNISYAFEPMQ